MKKSLAQLLAQLQDFSQTKNGRSTHPFADAVKNDAYNRTEITGITTDPNKCRPGFIYVADESETVDSTRYGVRLDGRDYINDAIKGGAVAVLTTPDVTLPEGAAFLLPYEKPLALLGPLAALLYGPPVPSHVAMITGTNGKTSTVNFCRMLWTFAGLASCSIGNLGGVCSDGSLVWDRDPDLSVPETVTLHGILHDLAARGIDRVAMEATSHALFDFRLHGAPGTIGAFTNLTKDHLDFHQTMEEYFRTKMKLFNEVLPPGSWAVLNADAEHYERALEICRKRGHKIMSYGLKGSDLRLLKYEPNPHGQWLAIEYQGRKYQSQLNLSGFFQASNVLCSLAIVIASGLDAEQAIASVSGLTEVEGRLNTVAITPTGGKVIVDYAHTPDGLRAALEACRDITTGKLSVLFGCDGERDTSKRAEMGEVAARLADTVIVTDVHPRHEDPAEIRRQIMIGAPGALEIAGRVEAIKFAIAALKDGDTALLAGMGHENYLSVGDQILPYSDRETAIRLVSELAGKKVF